MKSFRKMCRGEKGFTLIELLVVIIILGVLAAVVTLAVTRFIGKGKLESANAELVTVQAAIDSCLAEANSGYFDNTSVVTAWTGAAPGPLVTITGDPDSPYRVYDQMRTHKLKAAYTITAGGDITNGDPSPAGVAGWGPSIVWDQDDDVWVKVTATP